MSKNLAILLFVQGKISENLLRKYLQKEEKEK